MNPQVTRQFRSANLAATLQEASASDTRIMAITIHNAGTAQFIQIHDDAGDTLGTDAPVYVIHAPASVVTHLTWPGGLYVKGSVQIAATTTATGAVAPAATPTLVSLWMT